MTRVKQVGDRIEEILGFLRSDDGQAAAAAEELVGLLIGMYGAHRPGVAEHGRDAAEAVTVHADKQAD